MNELDTARIVKRYLDYGVESLSPKLLARVTASRELALERSRHLSGRTVPRNSISLTAKLGHFLFGRGYALRNLAFAVMMILGIGVAFYISNEQKIDDLAEIDSALLTDVLPIDAFTDKGFDAWLKNSSVQQSS